MREVRDGLPRIRTVVPIPLTLPSGQKIASKVFSFSGLGDDKEHFAVELGDPSRAFPTVRLHSECVTGDVFGSARCDCGAQLSEAIARVHSAGGYLLYLRQEGRGIGLYRKLEAYELQDRGFDTYEANRALGHGEDERDYTPAANMLKALGVRRVNLISNNPKKSAALIAAGIHIHEILKTGLFLEEANRRYLEAKVRYSNHTLNIPGLEQGQWPV